MPVAIKYQCEFCGEETNWIFYEDSGLFPNRARGCSGAGCTNVHYLSATEIDEDQAEALRSHYVTVIESDDGTEEVFDNEQ
jgi:hypothetical protein